MPSAPATLRHLVRQHHQLLLFGLLTALFSGPGQTFLISFFMPGMRQDFGLSQTAISGIYSAATLCSALFLPLLGRVLDRYSLVKFTLCSAMLLALGCVVLGVSYHWGGLLIGFLLIRNMGQGGMALISMATMARHFGAVRGKALGIANLGYPLGEAFFPVMISSWIYHYSWRSGWLLLAGFILVFFLPMIFLLLRNCPQERASQDYGKEALLAETNSQVSGPVFQPSFSLFSEKRFRLLALSLLIPPAYLTALFFHQTHFIEWKGWSMNVIASGFIGFAISRAGISFLMGALVDKYSARRLFPWTTTGLGVGILFLIFGQSSIWGLLYLLTAGMTMGMSMTLGSALWAELYGTEFLGFIKGKISRLVVISTAVAPLCLGWLLDLRVPETFILSAMIGVLILGMWLVFRAMRLVKYP